MKKKSIFALCTILLGVLSPATLAIADTLSSSSGEPIPHTSVNSSNSSEASSSSLITRADEEPIDSWMPDKALQSAISQQLNIPIEDLTKQDMLKLTSLSYSIFPSKGIVSLKGMEYATNLAGDVDLNYNSISDISPLYSTKITYLRLAGNNISDVSQFLNMPYLTTLVVPQNHIRDLSPLLGSQYTTIIATDQTITLLTQEVFSKQAVSDLSGVKRPGGAVLEGFTGVTSYDQSTDTLNWQLDGSQPENVYANWNDDVWIRANYNQLGTGSAGFSGEIVQPLTYKADIAADVTVNYIDDNNTPIHTPQVISGSVGEPYDATTEEYQLNIPGYFLDTNNLPSNAKGMLSDQPQTVTYVYSKDQTAVNVHDSSIYVGDEWKPEDNFDNATAADGTSLDYAGFIAAGGVVDDSKMDTNTPGTYPVAYTLNGVTATANITVKENKAKVNVHNSIIYVGDNWTAQDNFDSALDKDGNPVDFAQVTVDASKVDTSKAGTFDVTYTYDGVTSTATVTVKDKQTAVNVHNSRIYVGDDWSAQDNFDSALDKDGNAVDFSQVTVDDSQANTSKAGTFDVTYTYDGITSTATVTVLDKVSPKPMPEIPKDDGKNTDLPRASNNHTSSTSGKSVAHENNDKMSEHKSRKALPQTGASNGVYLTLIGLAVLVGIVLTFSLKNKPRRK